MPHPHFSKHFTVDEAQEWIPRLRELFDRVQTTLDELREDVTALRQVTVHMGNGGGVDVPQYAASSTVLDAILDEIQGAGIVIQDVQRGLVDFPSWLDEREVFLCWQLDDGDQLGWYHELEAGFAGRQPLPRA